jgi:phosphopantothenoylcysteine decarboxylase/phosphopantothenate--cysteine ligase
MSATVREVVLGVGAGIAAYKSCELLRRLQDRGYAVTVVPTPSSLNFVGSATWEALSGRPVNTQVWDNVHDVAHVSLAQKADFFLIAPATADLIARITAGRADDLLTNLVLATEAPLLIVPAMHPAMWLDPATVENVRTLRSRGYVVMEPEVGRLTGTDSGQGRFPETSAIIEKFDSITGNIRDLVGKRILISGGGTREAIDPVRFIGNRSSGKQACALATAALLRGADVHLVAANMSTQALAGATITEVESALDMQRVLTQEFPQCDVLVMCAAVADAKPVMKFTEKIKKTFLTSIELEPNPDIVAELAQIKKGQLMIGFAAETSDHLESARAKLVAKGLDAIYVNDVSNGAIFGKETTQGMILSRTGADIALKEVSKDALAHLLLDYAAGQLG